MKRYVCTAVAVAAVMLAISCGSKSSVDTKPIENSFASAEPATKSTADKAVTAIKAGDYSAALGELKSLGSKAKLTPEQEQAIKDVMAQVEKAITEMAGKAKEGAEKAAEDLQKSLKK